MMFNDINAHKYLFMIEIKEHGLNKLKIIIAEGGADVDAPELTAKDIPNTDLRKVLKGSKPITITPDNTHYEINFPSFIAYAITDKVYAVDNDSNFDGKNAGTYTESAFLKFIEHSTYATKDVPGPFTHYCFWCFNQRIDIASAKPPVVTEISR